MLYDYLSFILTIEKPFWNTLKLDQILFSILIDFGESKKQK